MATIAEIKSLLDGIEANPFGRIGIGITTHNRYDLFKKSYGEVKQRLPQGAVLVVVDDASTIPVPEADFRFNSNVGIAVAKNKCLELLYKQDCDHYFLFDDDVWPVSDRWYEPYCKSKEPHLNYIFKNFATGKQLNDTIELYRDSEIVAYSHTRGCRLYINRDVLERVGGMDPIYQRWGFEHGSWSDRIFMAGLTSFRYMDVVGSDKLFYSDDEHSNNVNTTVKGNERSEAIKRNAAIYESKKFSDEYIPFFGKENIFLTCYFTGVKDTQNREWTADLEALQPLIDSVKSSRLVVLHDCFTDDQVRSVPGNITFERVETSINPYFQRWVSYRQYLTKNAKWIDKVFCIDGTDVEILQEPRWAEMGDFVYTGDEPDTLDDAAGWMRGHHQHKTLIDFLNKEGKRYQLLNAGVLGGNIEDICDFMRAMIDFYCFAENDSFFLKRPNAGDTDMAVFNYIARTLFNDRLRYGREATTTFKANERNGYSWIKHK